LFAARYHARIGSLAFLPEGVRRTARESIGTSLAEAARQPAGAAQHLITVAHRAFLSSMRLTYAALVLVVVAAIGVAYKWLPATAPSAAISPEPDQPARGEDGVERVVDADDSGVADDWPAWGAEGAT
jgi:hypothetical protein